MKDRLTLIAGGAVYLILLLFSILLYQERTIIFDPAFHLFTMVRTGEFAIQVHRFGAFLSQLLPVLFIKLGLPLKAVMMSYSASFILLDAVLFVLLVRPLRQPVWALVLLLNSILMVNETFYWTQSELKQGLSILIFFFGLIQSGRLKPTSVFYLPVHALIPAILAFTHPLLLFPFVFGLVLLYRRAEAGAKKRLATAGLTFFVFYFIKTYLFRNWYDNMQVERLSNLSTYFPNYFAVPSNSLFVKYLIEDYHFLILFALLTLFFLVKNRHWFNLVWFTVFCTGYVFLVNASYPDPEALKRFYLEQLYLPLGAMTLMTFFAIAGPLASSRWLLPGIALVSLVRLVDIYALHQKFTEKIEWQRRFMQSNERDKVMWHQNDVPESSRLIYTWGSAEEFWLLSTLETGTTRSILVTDDIEGKRKYLDRTNLFITHHKVFDYGDLPKRYFIFTDSSSAYTILPNQ